MVTISYGYDQNNNHTSMTDPVGITAYTYDEADRLTSLTNPKGEGFGFSFDAANRITSATRPGGNSTFAFDDANFVTSIVHNGFGGGVLASFNYQMDAVGNRTKITELSGNHDFTYDPNSQLTTATHPDAPAENYSYDSIANRKTDQGGNYTYDAKSQRLAEDYRNFYFYDNNGNLVSKQKKGLNGDVTNYLYSSENQLIGFNYYPTASTTPSKEVTYVYDALGRRVEKIVVDHTAPSDVLKTFTRRYVYDGQEIALEYNSNNSLLARYTHSSLRTDDVLAVDVKQAGVDSKVAQTAGSHFYVKDGLGTITDITDSAGNKLQHYVYNSFGSLLSIKTNENSETVIEPKLATTYSFTGRELDSESGLYFYRARYYDSNVGRFINADSDSGSLEITASVNNRYVYAINSPTAFTDPSGEVLSTWIESGTRGLNRFTDNKLGGKSLGLALAATFVLGPLFSNFTLVNFSGLIHEEDQVRANKVMVLSLLIGLSIALGAPGLDLAEAGALSVAEAALGTSENGDFFDRTLNASLDNYALVAAGAGWQHVQGSPSGSTLGKLYEKLRGPVATAYFLGRHVLGYELKTTNCPSLRCKVTVEKVPK